MGVDEIPPTKKARQWRDGTSEIDRYQIPPDSGTVDGDKRVRGAVHKGDGYAGSATEQAHHVWGILAPPRVSRNQNLYLPRELQRGDGKRIPFYDEHEDFEIGEDGHPTGRILKLPPRGYADLKWNPEMQRLEYDGYITDDGLAQLVKAKKRKFVSLAANPAYFDHVDGDINVPRNLDFFSLSTVDNPGIPETTLNMEKMVMEKFVALPIQTRLSTKFMVCEGLLSFDDKPVSEILKRARKTRKVAEDAAFIATKRLEIAKITEVLAEREGLIAGEPTGNLPKAGASLHKKVYQASVDSGDSPSKAAKKAWGAVKNAGYKKDKDDKWSKEDNGDGATDDNDDEDDEEDDRWIAIFLKNPKLADAPEVGEAWPPWDRQTPVDPQNPNYKADAAYPPQKWPGAMGVLADPHGKSEPDPTPEPLALDNSAYYPGRPNSLDTTAFKQSDGTASAGTAMTTGGSPAGPTFPKGVPPGGPGNPFSGTAKPEITAVQPGPQVTNMPYTGNQEVEPAAQVAARNQPMSPVRPMPSDPHVAFPQESVTPVYKQVVASEANIANPVAESVMATKEGSADAEPAQDSTVKQAASVMPDRGVEPIGLPSTPYEALRSKVLSGKATASEQAQFAKLTPRGYVNEEGEPGFSGSQPSKPRKSGIQATDTVNKQGSTSEEEEEETKEEEEETKEQADDLPQSPPTSTGKQITAMKPSGEEEEEEEEEKAEAYGFTKETWSTFSRAEKKAIKRAYESTRKKVTELVNKRLEEAGLIKPGQSISDRRESKFDGGQGGLPPIGTAFGFEYARTPELEQVLKVMQGQASAAIAHVPLLTVPRDPIERTRLKATVEAFNDRFSNLVKENITTGTSGAALGVDEMTPALVVPTNIAALVRDTLLFRALPQGVDRARFQTVTVPAAGALSEDTEPSQSTQTLATVDVTTSPRGLETDVSFEAERKIIGPILDAMVLANRLSELYDEDYLLLGASQGFESVAAAPPTGWNTGGILAVQTGNQWFGDGTVAAEASITSTMTMTAKVFDWMRSTELKRGYSPDNLVSIEQPNQVYALFNDTNIVRYLQFGMNFDQVRSMVGQGIIPQLFGVEIRQSTLASTGLGSPTTSNTYHGWGYKKGLTGAMAASRDVMIETFRDIRKNATVLKSHWDLGTKVVHPFSLVEFITA